MAATLAREPNAVTPELLLRVMHDFDELPTMRLTAAQVMRLWSLDRPTCDALLTTLMKAHFLERDAASGQFAKRDETYRA
jgi:DNA-binding IclR family transcriptional regulator